MSSLPAMTVLALLELSQQRWHVVELVVAILQPALVLLLCLGFVLASAHLITMLGTRWGDRGTSSKALFFSLAVHASFALGIVALIPEYRQRIFFAASRDSEHTVQVLTPENPSNGPQAAARSMSSQPVWDRVATQGAPITTRTAMELTRPEPESAPARVEPDVALTAPRDSVGMPLPDSVARPVRTESIELASVTKPRVEIPIDAIPAEARPDYKGPTGLSRGVPGLPSAVETERPAAGSNEVPTRNRPDFDPSRDLASLGTVGRDASVSPPPPFPIGAAAPGPEKTAGSRKMSPAPGTLLETAETGIAPPQKGPAAPRPSVSSTVARIGAGQGVPSGASEEGVPSRFPAMNRGGDESGSGDRPRRGDGDLARIDGLPSLSPTIPRPRMDPLSPAPPGVGKTPAAYQLRAKEQRDKAVVEFGGSEATEAAVDRSLKFLASAQAPEGYWDAKAHGAGRTRIDEDGVDRQNVGRDADVGVTALAVLSFLGKMNTTEQGPHRETVTRGLRWLAAGQARDGFLGRDASEYCAMYCHGMATFALAEAYALSEDKQANAWLRGPLAKAVSYTLDSQLADGGWRYLKGQPDGDMSMFGWQLMSLRSAEAAGVAIPTEAKNKMIEFLQSRSLGKQGGLAAYRQGDAVTAPMTAESLFCKQMLGIRPNNPACSEAVALLETSLPSREKYNLYYWYYGTLAMFQYGGEPWGRWNGSLRDLLVSEQLKTGPNAGSWEPRDRWGGAGGRIYSTAMATMCLEVYYRYLPLYQGVPTQLAPARGPAPVE